MFETKISETNFENKQPFEFTDSQKEEIEALLADPTKHLGDGRTAKVYFLESNNKICVKIFKKPEEITNVDFFLPPSREKIFLEDLKYLDTKARVPNVYLCYEDGDNNFEFLMMETLPAMSVDDVLQGRRELPANFDLASFRDDLVDFVQKMHQAGVYHRDLHAGNIMIDQETCQVYIIDFGAAVEFRGEPEPGERGPYHVSKDGRTIILTSDEAKIRSVVRELAGILT